MPACRRGSRKGGYMMTHKGLRYYPLDPQVKGVEIEDIAHALSHQCRFGGHCSKFYSVAQHSVLVSKYLEKETGDKELALKGLLHDAAEAYMVDIPRPVKQHIDGYEEMEDALLKVVGKRFGVKDIFTDEVKFADDKILSTEARDLMGNDFDAKTWNLPEPCDFEVKPVGNVAAKTMFLKRFEELTSK